MPKWIEYTGSDEQIEEMQKSEHGFICINNSGIRSSIIKAGFKMAYISPNGKHEFLCLLIELKKYLDSENTNSYLICEPHPNADIIKIWADTGCEVYVRITFPGNKDEFPELAEYIESVEHTETYVTDKPNWNMPGAEYKLTPFEDHK